MKKKMEKSNHAHKIFDMASYKYSKYSVVQCIGRRTPTTHYLNYLFKLFGYPSPPLKVINALRNRSLPSKI